MCKYLFLVVFFCACEENDTRTMDLWIDSECEDSTVEHIYASEEALNALSEEHVGYPVVSIQGFVEVDHSKWRMVKTQTLVCHYDVPEWDDERWKGAKGAAFTEAMIMLFFHRYKEETLNDAAVALLVRHEMMHYAGVLGHTEDLGSIMCPGGCSATEYTTSDVELFCGTYDCEEE